MSVQSNDTNLSDLLNMVSSGKAQLPEFQRSWVWSDSKIKKLIESIASGFPMGAAMFLENGGNIKFKCRLFEGVDKNITTIPDYLVLDGQQRLTTLSQVFYNKSAVNTTTDNGKTISRYYYLDIKKATNPQYDIFDAIVAVSETKKITANIGRDTILDLSKREYEYEQFMYPLNILFSTIETTNWLIGFSQYHNDNKAMSVFNQFNTDVLTKISAYKIPIIYLTKDTPKEAVCQIFENVNTGGVPLTVFELVTATFAADEFNLREDWSKINEQFKRRSTDVLNEVSGTNFITAMTLLSTYKKSLMDSSAVSCKKKDVLRLELSEYKQYRDSLIKGFEEAANFLNQQGIYTSRDIPYGSQMIPLAAILAHDIDNGKKLSLQYAEQLKKWYWCGVFGELYGGANETRFALDISDIFLSFKQDHKPDTVIRSNFQATRLLSMYTRNSAAYKGVMGLIMKDSPLDFMSANKMDIASYNSEGTDIHHIFPHAYCIKPEINYPKKKWDSVINKTPIYASTNRSIGGRAPSEYIKTMENKGLNQEQIDVALKSHKINPELVRNDMFDKFIIDRAVQILDRIEKATGKVVAGRDSEETILEFGAPLIKNSFQ